MSDQETNNAVKKDNKAKNSMILGIAAFFMMLVSFMPGLLSYLGCVNPLAALFAIISGIQGMRAIQQGAEGQRSHAVIGIVLAVLSTLIFFGYMLLAVNSGINYYR